MQFYLAQIIGIVVLIIRVIGVQFAKKRNIFLSLCLVNFLYIAHYFLIGDLLSVIVCFMGTIQTITVTLLDDRKPKTTTTILITCAVLAIVVGFFNFTSTKDILPLLSVVFSTIALLMKKEQLVRIFLGLTSLCWLFFDLLIGAYTMSITDSIFIISTIIAIIRYLPASKTKVQELESVK